MRFFWIAATSFFFAATPAVADVTARYGLTGSEQPMIVQVRDNGDSRIVVTGAVYLAMGGKSYMVMSDAQGQFVVRKEDFLSLMAELMRRPSATGLPDQRGPVLSEHETETVGGRSGRRYRISAGANSTDYMEFVVSDDPALAELGRVMANELEPIFSSAVAGTDARLAELANDLFHRGAMLRLGNEWRLQGVETEAIPESLFVLPSAPISRAALAARLGAPAP